MKVLMLNEIKDWGGGEVLTLDLALSLKEKGVSITLGCNPDSMLQKRADEAGIRVVPINMRNELDIFAVIYLVALINKENFDILHCHTMRDHVLGSLACRYTGVTPVVRTQHIHFPENPSIMAQLAYKKWTDVIICNSDFIKKNLKKAGLSNRLLKVIHNGINFNRMKKYKKMEPFHNEIGLIEEDLIIGCVGSLFATKGQTHLLQSFPGVLERYPKSNLVFVGDGPCRGELESIAKKLQVEKKVFFLGRRKDVPHILKSCSVLVVPSVWEEPFGLVNVEAMFAEVPLIASSTGGIPEIVENNVTGLLVTPGDHNALTHAILKIFGDSELKDSIVRNARSRVLKEFSAGAMADKTIEVYSSLLNNS